MRPRNPLRLLGRLLGWPEPLPRITITEDVNNVGYFVTRDSIPRQAQEEWLEEIASL